MMKTTKWLMKQTKPFIPALILMIIAGVITAMVGVATAVVSKNLIDFAVAKENNRAVNTMLVFFVLILVQIGLRAFLSTKSVKVMERYSNGLRSKVYQKIVKSSWTDFTKYHSDDVLTRLTSDIQVVTGGMTDVIPNILSLVVQLIFSFATLFYFDRVLALLAIAIAPVSLLFYRFFRKKMKDLHIKIQETEGIYRAYLHECMQNIGILKVFSIEDQSSKRIAELQNDRVHWVLKRNRMNVTTSSILSFGYYIGFLLAFSWGALRLSQGIITFGTMTVFFQLVGQVQAPFISIARSIPQLVAAEGSAMRLMELEGLKQEAAESWSPEMNEAGIEFENVAFSYKQGKPVLQKVTASISPGEIVAIIGPSGEGKTTLIRLVLSLLEQNNGRISITGRDRKFNLNPKYRSLISYVPQGNTLFSGSIVENLKVGNPEAKEEDIIQALKDASAYDFVCGLKDGIHSVIGERGVGLSEGQAQRLTIARALLRKAPILILDEATSALDEETELKVLHAIREQKEKPTCLFITHRPTVYRLMDRVLRLKNGILVEKVD